MKGLAAAAVMLAAVALAVFALAPDSARALDYDCPDFTYQAEAEEHLLEGDPYNLDADSDGKACEDLPCPCSYGGSHPPPPPPPKSEPYRIPMPAARSLSHQVIHRVVARSSRLDSMSGARCVRLGDIRIDCRLYALGRSPTQRVACQYRVAVGALDRHPIARVASHRCRTKTLS